MHYSPFTFIASFNLFRLFICLSYHYWSHSSWDLLMFSIETVESHFPAYFQETKLDDLHCPTKTEIIPRGFSYRQDQTRQGNPRNLLLNLLGLLQWSSQNKTFISLWNIKGDVWGLTMWFKSMIEGKYTFRSKGFNLSHIQG